jgi:hypothetical protein
MSIRSKIVALLSLLALVCAAHADGLSSNWVGDINGLMGGGVHSSFSPQAQAFFARLATQPNTARKQRYDTFFKAITAAGIVSGTNMDAIYALGVLDQPTALTNLMQATCGATATNSPNFVMNQGFVGNSNSGAVVDTNCNPSSTAGLVYAQNSASIGSFSLTPDAIAGESIGYGTAGTGYVEIYNNYPANGRITAMNATVENTVSLTDGSGFISMDRSNASGYVVYKNGVSVSTPTATSAALASADITILAQGAHTYNYGTVQFAFFGGHLTATQHLALYNAMVAFQSGIASDYPTFRQLAGTRNGIPSITAAVPFATSNSFNVRRATYFKNACVNPAVVYVGFGMTSTIGNLGNAITYTTSIEPSNGATRQQFLKGGSANHLVSPGDNFNISDTLPITIPAGMAFVWTHAAITTGQNFYPSFYTANTGVGDQIEEGNGLADKTLSGTITTGTSFVMPSVSGIICDEPTGHKTFSLLGDSNCIGLGGYAQPLNGDGSGGGQGYMAGYLDGRADYFQFCVASLAAATVTNTPSFDPLITFEGKANLNVFWQQLELSDLQGSGASAPTCTANIISTINLWTRGVAYLWSGKIYQTTGVPAVNVTGGPIPVTDSNQVTKPTVIDAETISSGTYVSGTGVVTLTVSAATALSAGVQFTVASLTGTGAFASLNGTFTTLTATGTTVTYQAASGLGATTITGGSLTSSTIQEVNSNIRAGLAGVTAVTEIAHNIENTSVPQVQWWRTDLSPSTTVDGLHCTQSGCVPIVTALIAANPFGF